MKATELMLNDLVVCNNKVCKVCSIEGVMILVSFKDGEKLTIEDNIEPIPLTPEILEKNGFEYCGNSFYYYDDNNGVIVRYDTWDKRLRIIQDLNIRFDGDYYAGIYVHTLQHALRLCGIDKEITL